METRIKKKDVETEGINRSGKAVVGDFRDGLHFHRLPENYRRQFVYQELKLKAPAVPKGPQGLIL